MRHHIGVSEDRTHIVQKIWGEITPGPAVKCTEESHALGISLGLHLYFVDATEARNIGGIFDNYELAYHMIDPAKVDRDAAIAILVHPDDHSHNFLETVARNAGYNVTLFRDREQALKHLLKKRSRAIR